MAETKHHDNCGQEIVREITLIVSEADEEVIGDDEVDSSGPICCVCEMFGVMIVCQSCQSYLHAACGVRRGEDPAAVECLECSGQGDTSHHPQVPPSDLIVQRHITGSGPPGRPRPCPIALTIRHESHRASHYDPRDAADGESHGILRDMKRTEGLARDPMKRKHLHSEGTFSDSSGQDRALFEEEVGVDEALSEFSASESDKSSGPANTSEAMLRSHEGLGRHESACSSEDFCHECRGAGNLRYSCATCPYSFHEECLSESEKKRGSSMEDSFQCERCIAEKVPQTSPRRSRSERKATLIDTMRGENAKHPEFRDKFIRVGDHFQVPHLPSPAEEDPRWQRVRARMPLSAPPPVRVWSGPQWQGQKSRVRLEKFIKLAKEIWPVMYCPFEEEFALAVLHRAEYDCVAALRQVYEASFDFDGVCLPPVKEYLNKWSPAVPRGQFPTYPPFRPFPVDLNYMPDMKKARKRTDRPSVVAQAVTSRRR